MYTCISPHVMCSAQQLGQCMEYQLHLNQTLSLSWKVKQKFQGAAAQIQSVLEGRSPKAPARVLLLLQLPW